MNIHEFSERYKISMAKSRLILKEESSLVRWIHQHKRNRDKGMVKRNGQPLTAMQLCELIENPGFILQLGKHAHKAQQTIERLGNVQAEIAPKMVAACITDARSKGSRRYVQSLTGLNQ